MKILILSMYDQLSASTRQRYSQFSIKALEKDIKFDIKPLLCNKYLLNKFNKNKFSIFYIIKRIFLRLYFLIFQYKYDFLIIQFEIFPYLPYFFEKLLIRKKYICDIDDAFHLRYQRLKYLKYIYKNKFKNLIKNACFVSAGSDYLKNYAALYNKNVILLPTSVNIDRYKKVQLKKDKFVLGWIGSPSTARYLKILKNVLIKLSKKIDFKLLIIGGKFDKLPNVEIQELEWNFENEINHINSMDVGLMPLNNNEWEKGKCSFKLIQYMACEIPVIASPVGFNIKVVDHETNGYLPKNENEWYNFIIKLYNSKDLRKKMGISGREKVINFFASDIIFEKLIYNIEKHKSDHV